MDERKNETEPGTWNTANRTRACVWDGGTRRTRQGGIPGTWQMTDGRMRGAITIAGDALPRAQVAGILPSV